MATTLTRLELDKMTCHGCAEEHPLVLHSNCHVDDPTWVWYDKNKGVLTVTCARCDATVATIAVAPSPSTIN